MLKYLTVKATISLFLSQFFHYYRFYYCNSNGSVGVCAIEIVSHAIPCLECLIIRCLNDRLKARDVIF